MKQQGIEQQRMPQNEAQDRYVRHVIAKK